MSADTPIISAQELSKAYRIGRHPSARVRTTLPNLLANLLPKNSGARARLHRAASAGYRDFQAVQPLSFALRRGEALGIIGRNGSGKSTLLKCLAKILPPTTGSIDIEGADFLPIIQPYSMCEPGDTVVNNIHLLGRILGFKNKGTTEVKIELLRDDTDQMLEKLNIKN